MKISVHRISVNSIHIGHISRILLITLNLLLCSSPTFAAFGVHREYQTPELYDDGQTSCSSGPVTATALHPYEEEALRLENLPIKEERHYYGRFAVNGGTYLLANIRNRSLSGDSISRVLVPRARVNTVGLELALGFIYSREVRFELEYLVNRNFDYIANPVLGAPFPLTNGLEPVGPRNLKAEITNNTFLINGYYELVFDCYENFRPFAMVGIGPSFNSVKTKVTPPFAGAITSRRTKQYVSLAAGGGLGFRYQFCNRWYFTASMRFIYMGNVNIEPNPQFRLQGTYTYVPLSIGVMYIF